MVDLPQLMELLKTPNLDEDTIKLINAKIREELSTIRNEKDPVNLLGEWLTGEVK